MHDTGSFLNTFKQNNILPIRLIAPGFGHVSAEVANAFGYTHRKSHYFLLFMVKGCVRHGVDLEQFDVTDNELLFILPHQIHELSSAKHGEEYFKIGFDEECLSLLPKQYPFLINPLNRQKISFAPSAAARVNAIFRILQELLSVMDTDAQLLLAHLNSLLTEINAAYFATDKNPADVRLSKYISFKLFVENNLTDHTSVNDIAEKMGINTNSLYNLVKHYSGLSPKEFITNRLMLEAKRRLYYAESPSIKELAYDLGYNDPEYFARLFKKETGKTIATFLQDLSGN